MADMLKPGIGFVFMKVGTHAREPLTDIIARKRKEIEDAGYALWGYGGNTCHPLTMVQPFARDFVQRDGVIYLCMQPMASQHFAIPERASSFSPAKRSCGKRSRSGSRPGWNKLWSSMPSKPTRCGRTCG